MRLTCHPIPSSRLFLGEQAQAPAERFSANDLKAIDRDNALRILPRLRAA
jgi:hypothetical protein